jgi:hypothetical protein
MITRPEFTDEDITMALNKIMERFNHKIKKKGKGIFISRLECGMKLKEESDECFDEIHKKDDKKLIEELTDVGVVSILSIISLTKIINEDNQ